MIILLPLGLLAGALTTIAGLGGGVLLVIALSLVWDPLTALAVTAPALLVGTLHRAWLYRHDISVMTAPPLVLGTLVGSITGGLVAATLPQMVLRVVMLVVVLIAVARAAGFSAWRPPLAVVGPAAVGIGIVGATAGGAGLLLSPLVMAGGARGPAYIGTTALAAVALHLGRLIGYGVGGRLDGVTLTRAAGLAIAILAGNFIGARSRTYMSDKFAHAIEVAALIITSALAFAGLA